jgi:hypothetical protein
MYYSTEFTQVLEKLSAIGIVMIRRRINYRSFVSPAERDYIHVQPLLPVNSKMVTATIIRVIVLVASGVASSWKTSIDNSAPR